MSPDAQVLLERALAQTFGIALAVGHARPCDREPLRELYLASPAAGEEVLALRWLDAG